MERGWEHALTKVGEKGSPGLGDTATASQDKNRKPNPGKWIPRYHLKKSPTVSIFRKSWIQHVRRVDQQIPSRPIPGRRRPAAHFLVAGGRQSLGPHGPWFLQSSASWVLNRQKSPHAWVTAIATRLATGQRGAVTNFGALGVGLGLRHVTTFGNVSPGSNGTFRGASQVLKAISADKK